MEERQKKCKREKEKYERETVKTREGNNENMRGRQKKSEREKKNMIERQKICEGDETWKKTTRT